MQTRRTRFLPKALTFELRRLPWRLLGLLLAALAAACWLALITWSYGDPSPNYATVSQPQNWLGRRGASLADSLMQAFGLAAPFLVLPLAALGLQMAGDYSPLRPRLRLIFWVGALLGLPAFFGAFPTPSRWVLNTGLGGIVGDFVAARAAKLSSMVMPLILWPAFTFLVLLFGTWCLWRACGFGKRELALALSSPRGDEAANPSFDDPFATARANGFFANKVTSWTKRLSPRNRALVPQRQPREFWPVTTKTEPSFSSASTGSFGREEIATAVIPRTSGTSPFSNWGSSPSRGVAADRAGNFQSSEERSNNSGEDIFDDLRIEPFFGPRRPGSTGDGEAHNRGSQEGAAASPFRRLTQRAINGAEEVRRGFSAKAANAAEAQKPLLYGRNTSTGQASIGEDIRSDFSTALPPLSMLAPPPRAHAKPGSNDPALVQRSTALMEVLSDFGIKGRIAGIYPGPVITLFELEPARGTKSSRVVGLADDIARSMSAVSARVAVVPGRDAIGIELPNARREIVSLRGILGGPAFQESAAALPLALGKSIGGEPIVVDLARMPHLLIAGTTGSGKSVGINTMILSLLYRLPPSQCNFIMIDPKMLELSVYDGIPHLLAPVVTDPKKAVLALKWTVKEMNSRYERMSKLGVRNIMSYNAKAAAAQLRGQPLRRAGQTGFHHRAEERFEDEEVLDPVSMPYIVVVIDEMADLMMVAGKDIEFAVQRLSQMARAAGIHLIMATQRPSVDVVTGTIKANFPSRISFQVTSKIDSRTIIGEQGAEQLLGAGDMLYMASGGRIIRVHGPFVSDDEVDAVARHLKAQGFPNYRDDILEDDGGLDEETSPKANGDGGRDIYERAVEIVLKDRKPTTSYLQRRLGIGYNRAASLIERMEQEGIVGAPGRTGRREILLGAEQA